MLRQPRVLHLLASNRYSGAENVACTMIQNYKGEAFYCSPAGPIEESLKKQKISYIPWDKKLSSLKQIIKQNQIEVIHAHDFKCSVAASFLANKVKVISHLHCNPRFLKSWNPYSCLYAMRSKKFKHIIVVSNEILEGTVFYPQIKDKVTVLPNVVDAKKVIQNSKEFPTTHYDLIFLGRLIPLKRPLFFIELVAQLVSKYPSLKACILGDGELYEACKEKITELGLEKNMDMMGFKENPFPYLKNAKAAILPSTTEGLPMSVIECMILGVPVINSGVGGLSKMFEKHPEYLCETVEDYIHAVETVFHKSPEEIRQECESLIDPYVNMDRYMKQIETIYQGK